MARPAIRALAAASLAVLFACSSSGSGASGGTSGGSGGAGLSLKPTALTFTAVAGGPLPSAQTVTISLTAPDAAYLAVGYPPGVSAAPWLATPTLSGTGQTRWMSVAVNTTSLTPATLTTTLRVVAARADQTPIAYRDVAVTYVLRSFGAMPTAVTSTSVLGGSTPPAPHPLTVSGPSGTTWSATADQPWVSLSSKAGTVPSTTMLTFDPSGLAFGAHQAVVTFSGAGQTATVVATLDVVYPTLSATPPSVALAGASGHDLSPKTVQLALDTGTNAYAWTATASDPWLEISPASGTMSSTPAALTIRPSADAATWPAGTPTKYGKVTVTADVNGRTLTKTVGVTYTVDEHRILVEDAGVALTSTPSLSRLTRAVRVRSNRGLTVGWSASSDQTWLTVTTGGTTADALVLTADPTGLAEDALYEANVTVTSSDPGIANVETIHVGLWVGSATPAALQTVAASYAEVASDPVRPYAYVHSGGTDVSVYHVHTGALVATIPSVATRLGSMAVSSEGGRLFVTDASTTPPKVVPVDLATRKVGTAWPLAASAWSNTRIAYARTDAVPLLVAGDGTVYDPAAGTAYGATFRVDEPSMLLAVSRDGSQLCDMNTGNSPYDLACRSLDFTTAPTTSPVVLGAASGGTWGYGGNGQDVAVSADGSRVYVAAGAPYSFTVYDATVARTMPVLADLTAHPYPSAIEVDADGRIIGAGTPDYGDPTSLWVYDATGTLQSTYAIGSVRKGSLAVSGDALRAVAIADGYPASQKVTFLTIAP